ncbi:MAG: hypothetical protein PVJ39_09910 [Gammaproteobacteria bacterium]|jgi:hypothetical protein
MRIVQHKLFRIPVLLILVVVPIAASAMGNYPESTVCSPEKPYQAICTHSLHSLEGWYGKCYATREEAQQEADRHAKEQHNGNSRWTGVRKAHFKGASGY